MLDRIKLPWARKRVLQKQNVNGFYEKDGKLIATVDKKLKMSTIVRKIRDDRSPWTTDDIVRKENRVGFLGRKKETKVEEVGKVKALLDRKKYRPVKGKSEIGIRGERFVGTAGGAVTFKKYRNLYLLSGWYGYLALLGRFGLSVETKEGIMTNAHVTQKDVREPERNMIVQPGYNRYGVIGKAVYSLPIKQGTFNEFDVSVVETYVGIVREAKGWRDHVVGEQVQKDGRSTDHTTGKILAENVAMVIDYGAVAGNMQFKDLVMCSRMSATGDSGSWVYGMDGKVVGLLFAGSATRTFFIPIRKILQKLRCEVAV